jgi:hypothetical protein
MRTFTMKIGRGQTALRALREEARRKGLDKLSSEQVESMIAEARRGKRSGLKLDISDLDGYTPD